MDYWQRLQETTGGWTVLGSTVLSFTVISVLLAIFDPNSHRRLRAAVMLFILSLIGLCVAAWALKNGTDDLYLWLKAAARFLHIVAILTVAGVFLFDLALDAIHLRPPAILCDLLLAAAYLIAAAFCLGTANVNASAVVTAVIGFSLQDTLGNVMGGMAIQLERTISVGDWIKVEDYVGIVKEIRWRQTSIETSDWDTIVIPNSVLMKNVVQVFSRRAGQPRLHRQTLSFNVGFQSKPNQIIECVETALRDEHIECMAKIPAPVCQLDSYQSSFATYVIRYWLTSLHEDDTTDSVIRSRVWYALHRIGIEPSIPSIRQLQVNAEADRQKRDAMEHQERVAALEAVALFAPLAPEERSATADRLVLCRFARGESILRQGAEGDSLFIILHGEAAVRVAIEGHDATQAVAVLKDGDFVGEMSLMTGARRSATVVALSDVDCYKLDKAAMQDVLSRRPRIAEDLSDVLARRRVELETVKENLTEEAKRQRVQKTKGDLLGKIRRFFLLESA
jgi:small-conductance mechanosensitive channel/CRP-like cAMP-binding protein